ncbi:hypothetical protein D3C72_1901240 [compost metagenome]
MGRQVFRVETLIENALHGRERGRCTGNMRLAGITLDDRVIERAAIGGVRIAVEGGKRVQFQDASRIDRIGVAAQAAHFAEGIARWLQLGRRLRGRALCRFLIDTFIHQSCPMAIGLAALLQAFGKFLAAQRQKTLQPA